MLSSLNTPARLILLAGGLMLIGVGCYTPPNAAPRIAEPLTAAPSELVVAQRQGFGALPLPSVTAQPPGSHGSVRIDAELPAIPPEMTVLRMQSGSPNETELRNITKSLLIPIGFLTGGIRADEMLLKWRDESGARWSYTASARHLEVWPAPENANATSSRATNDDTAIISAALAFMGDHGLDLKKFSPPSVNLEHSTAPQAIVSFLGLQDGIPIRNMNGLGTEYANLTINPRTLYVTHASLTLPLDPDRSDYLTISRQEASRRLASGGLGGTPPGDVTIGQAAIEWLLVNDGRTPAKSYLIPALIGTGTILANGVSSPYTIVVPLIK